MKRNLTLANDAMHRRAYHLTTMADDMCKRIHEEAVRNHQLDPINKGFHDHLHHAVAMHPEWKAYCDLNRKAAQCRLMARKGE